MPIVAPNQGLPDLLAWLLVSTSTPPDLVLTLWVNDLTPDQETVFVDLDRATFGGFTERLMNRSAWTAPAVAADHAVSTWGTVPFEWTVAADPQTVYGWAAYEPFSEHLIFVERFDTPRALAVGGVFGVLPRVTLTTERLL